MTSQQPSRFVRIILCFLALLLLLPPVFSQNQPLTGSLTRIQGINVLTLTGNPRENGYARGFLLAQNFRDMVEAVSIFVPKEVDRSSLPPMIIPRVVRTEKDKEELEGMIEGMRAKLGPEGLKFEGYSRPLNADDLWVMLALPDLHCSAFAAWGNLTPDGNMIIGRNLDYEGKQFACQSPCIVVTLPQDPKIKPWVNFSPGAFPGASTSIREDGVFVAILDAAATKPATGSGNLRYFVLRDFLETAEEGENLPERAASFFRKEPILRGTNFLICSPKATACVVEYDGNLEKDSGVTIRKPTDGQDWVIVSNHFRERATAVNCNRYSALANKLETFAQQKKPITSMQEGWDIIHQSAQNSTLMTLVFRPSDQKILVSYTDGNRQAADIKPVEIKLSDLFPRKK